MHRSAAQSRWDHTAQILCQQYNLNRDPKAKERKPSDFHPYRSGNIGTRSGKPSANQHSNGMPVSQLHAFKTMLPIIHAE
jgi:hypothetical protein